MAVRYPSLGLSGGVGRPNPGGSGHLHPDLELNILLRGRATLIVAGRRYALRPEAPALFWAAQSHGLDDLGPDSWMVWLHLPLVDVLSWGLGPSLLPQASGAPILGGPDPARTQIAAGWPQDLRHPRNRLAAIEELRAWLRRLVPAARPSRPADASSAQMVHWLCEHYRERHVADRMARAVGLGRSQAHALVRRDTGLTPLRLATQLRLAHARDLIAGGAERGHAALAAGFGSLSRYYAAAGAVP